MFLCAFYEAHKNIKAVSYNKERNKLGVEIKIWYTLYSKMISLYRKKYF